MSLSFQHERELWIEEPHLVSPLSSMRAGDASGDSEQHQGGDVRTLVSSSGLREDVPRTVTETVLEEAARITSKDRNETYDHPSRNHQQTADLWSAFLMRKLKEPLTAREVCWMQTLLKASRDSFYPQRDNLVDGAGYLRNAEMIEEVQKD